MVGFPTETEEDFQMPKRLIYDVKFDWVEVYSFSPTSGIDASAMDGQIPEAIKEERFNRLYETLASVSLQDNEAFDNTIPLNRFYLPVFTCFT
jgi:tRNA A37 methylthiotransferase MiaB